jgi:hypothetical protein
MSRCTRPLTLFALAGILCAISGCDRQPDAAETSVAPIRSAEAEEPAASEDAGQGNGYAFHIRYPQLPSDWDALGQTLRTYAGKQKKDLIAARAAEDNTNAPPYSLDLEFNIARRTAEFVSVLANGSAYTGGAHPAPIAASFNLCTGSGRLIGLSDLFTNADGALQALSAESRRQLEGRYEARLRDTTPAKDIAAALKGMHERVERGTEPTAASFAVFLVDGLEAKAIGLTLIFPPSQVAADADGTQQVEVPAQVFYALLKPEYRDAFQIDTEADQLAPGVR